MKESAMVFRKLFAVAFAAACLGILAQTHGDRIKTKPPQISSTDLLELKDLSSEPQPKENQIDVLLTPGNATIRIWKQQRWITVHTEGLTPGMRARAAGAPYKHDVMKQYFEWKENEKTPPKGVIFVIIQQQRFWMAIDPKSGKAIAGEVQTFFYHFLVNPKSAKVVKEHKGVSGVRFRRPEEGKEPTEPKESPKST